MPVNTPEQEKAIHFRGGNLYVSASAGSGKTYVMISRMISHILKKECEVNEILALTYTRAAATEMKEKLRKAITERFASASKEDREFLSRQLRLLPLTTVGTIHSFCSALLKSYFFEAGVDPNFELLPEEEAKAMQAEALESIVERAYEKGEKDFLTVAAAFSSNRKDNALMETVQDVCLFAEAEKDAEEFFNACLNAHSEKNFLWVEEQLLSRLQTTLKEFAQAFTELYAEGVTSGYNENHAQFAKGLAEKLTEISKLTDVYALAQAFVALSGGKKPSVNKKMSAQELGWANRITAQRDAVEAKKKEYAKITTRADAEKANALAQTAVEVLIRLCKEYQAEYARLKAREGKMDFGDLERKTLALLQNSVIAQAVKARYRYVFVDEYQDVNGVQEAIFNLLTENNLFLVGDVKQSIYAFRGCNPELFNRKIAEGEKTGGHVRLSKNFRSASAVLSGVNQLFNRIMTPQTVGQDYALENLAFGEGYPKEEGAVAFCDYEKAEKKEVAPVVYSVKKDYEANRGKGNAEGEAVYRLISSLIGEEIALDDKGNTRKITYGDIAILYRKKGVAYAVAEELKRRDIPVSVEKEIPLTSSAEVSLLLSALRLATGSREDIPFVNLLLSPLGNMQESELKEVRAYQKRAIKTQTSFYCAAELFASRTGEVSLWEKEIQAKLQKAFALIEELTQKAEFISASELMEELCVTYSLRAHAYAKPMGKRRVNMMNRLIAEAAGTEGAGMFANAFLTRLDSVGKDLSYGETESGNAVKMMTMHASKGLEFPVVILCGLQRPFSSKDETGAVLLDRDMGVLPYAFNAETRTKTTTLHRILFREAYRKNRAKEEMRLLYVAMTRAKNRLYITRAADSVKEEEKDVIASSNFLSWMKANEYPTQPLPVGEERCEYNRRPILLSGGEDFAAAIETARAFTYPYLKAVAFPEKETVTGILARGKTGERVAQELAKTKERESYLLGTAESRKQRGIRIHAFMEKCDLTSAEESAVLASMRLFVERGELMEEDLASAPAISRILSSPVMEEVRKGQIFREREFTMLHSVDGEDSAVVQGVIDLISVAEDGIIIVDYKNSSLSDEELATTYKQQLDLYAEAAVRFYGIKIKKKVIINLTNESVITV